MACRSTSVLLSRAKASRVAHTPGTRGVAASVRCSAVSICATLDTRGSAGPVSTSATTGVPSHEQTTARHSSGSVAKMLRAIAMASAFAAVRVSATLPHRHSLPACGAVKARSLPPSRRNGMTIVHASCVLGSASGVAGAFAVGSATRSDLGAQRITSVSTTYVVTASSNGRFQRTRDASPLHAPLSSSS